MADASGASTSTNGLECIPVVTLVDEHEVHNPLPPVDLVSKVSQRTSTEEKSSPSPAARPVAVPILWSNAGVTN
jgi:hypothetical protein